MSQTHTEKITCPNCAHVSDFVVWDSINTELNPEMKEKVRTFEAFRFVCPVCGDVAYVNYSTLYHQMEDHAMIYLIYDKPEEAASLMLDMRRNKTYTHFASDYYMRVVTDKKQLKEKLFLLDAGLDDRVIETMKLFILDNLHEKDPDTAIEGLYFDGSRPGDPCFAVDLGNDQWRSIAFDEKMYQQTKKTFLKVLEKDKNAMIVDLDWVEKTLLKG